jgi:oligopeptide/dipeptide ABC transporter ATP-binding protein
MGLLPKKGSLVSGKCLFMGQKLRLPRLGPLDQLGKPKLAMVFQNPIGSLNPTMPAGKQVVEVLVAARMLSWAAAKDEALQLFKEVGIQNQRRCFFAYPHELSGGMRQRVVFAVMLAISPSLLIADEPTTALDVATQARILALLTKLKTTRGLGILFITHNLALAKGWADRVSVLYAGEIVEEGPSRRLFQDPRHPYTKGLLDSIPKLDADNPDNALFALPGSPPDPYTLHKGCAFAPRCPVARPYCKDEPAPWVTLEDGHRARCFAVKEALLL